jgi:hypothetical protein
LAVVKPEAGASTVEIGKAMMGLPDTSRADALTAAIGLRLALWLVHEGVLKPTRTNRFVLNKPTKLK